MPSLFDPLRIGDIDCANRVVMAPLTRDRAGPGRVPTALNARYYAQRAGAGLLITEATPVSPLGHGYFDTPGLHDDAQVRGWRAVTDAVHAAGGRIVVQLWHVGRISHTRLLPPGERPVSSSAVAAKTRTYVARGELVPVSEPRALRLDEIPGVVADYRRAARRAVEAGFDGVQLHAANGYLIDQFLRDSLNRRDDAYGGPIANRARLLLEVMQAMGDEIGMGRCGIRLSPVTPSNDAGADSDPQALHGHVVERLGAMGVAFVEVVEGATGGARGHAPFDYAALRRSFVARHPDGRWIVNNGYTRAMALQAVAEGAADAVSFGRPFIANPDLVRRLREDLPWATPDRDTFYGGGEAGYTDYPAWTGGSSVAGAGTASSG